MDGITFGKQSYNNSVCCRNFLNMFEKEVQSQIDAVIKQNGTLYDAWCSAVIQQVMAEVRTFKDELEEAKIQDAAFEAKIREKSMTLQTLEHSRAAIELSLYPMT